MGNSNSGVDAFLLGVGVKLELVFLTLELELELERSFENIDGVGVAYPQSCPSLNRTNQRGRRRSKKFD
jgi:hypothetical protein